MVVYPGARALLESSAALATQQKYADRIAGKAQRVIATAEKAEKVDTKVDQIPELRDTNVQADQDLQPDTQIIALKSLVKLRSAQPGRHLILTATPAVTPGGDPTPDGRRVRLMNTGTGNITLPSEAARRGSGLRLNSSTATIRPGETLDLTYVPDGSGVLWRQSGAAPGDLAGSGALVLRDDFEGAELVGWQRSSYPLGRGTFRPENVSVAGGRLRLAVQQGTLDGGEVQTPLPMHHYGLYTARIRACSARGSLTSLYLYKAPSGHSEIDIEIFRPESGDYRLNLVTYSGPDFNPSVSPRSREIVLPFDPSAEFHDYSFSYDPEGVSFYVDGELYWLTEKEIPPASMYLLANLWFPTWLSGPVAETTQQAEYEYIEHRTLPDSGPPAGFARHRKTHEIGGDDELPLLSAGMAFRDANPGVMLTIGSDRPTQVFSGADLSAERYVTLASAPGRYAGQIFRVTRYQGGAHALVVQNAVGNPLRRLAQYEWAELAYDGGGSWTLIAAGKLYA